jgi:hypothetical protein
MGEKMCKTKLLQISYSILTSGSIPVLYTGTPAQATLKIMEVHQISSRPDIRPDNPAFFDIRYPAEYQIVMPDIRPDIR